MKDVIYEYILKLVRATRSHPYIERGASPRATIALVKMAKASAWMEGRDFVAPKDVIRQFPYVASHRILLTGAAEMERKTKQEILREISQAQNDILRIGVILGLNLNLLFADTGGNKRIPEKPDFRHTMRSTNQRCNYPRNRYALNITVGIFPTHGKLSNDTATQKPRDHKWTHHQSGNNRPHDIVDKGRTMLADLHAHINIERRKDKCCTSGIKDHGVE